MTLSNKETLKNSVIFCVKLLQYTHVNIVSILIPRIFVLHTPLVITCDPATVKELMLKCPKHRGFMEQVHCCGRVPFDEKKPTNDPIHGGAAYTILLGGDP